MHWRLDSRGKGGWGCLESQNLKCNFLSKSRAASSHNFQVVLQ